MRIFIAGASGAIGARLVPMLVQRGHEVTGTTRTPAKAAALDAAGATAVVVDALDREAVMAAVSAARPEVVVHQLTAIAPKLDLRHIDRALAATNRLRTEGTDHLLAAARAAGARRLVWQSFASWPYAREGGPVKDEGDPLDPDPPAKLRDALGAIRHLEGAVLTADGLEGVVLRYGGFYGPGTGFGEIADEVRRRRIPVVGEGTGVWSFIHIDDAASATVAAIEGTATGLFNVVDDEPAPVATWLPDLAAALGAPPPREVPVWLARLLIGEHGVAFMTQIRGASNAKARFELGWRPAVASWRQGFRAEHGPGAADTRPARIAA
jgi:2-alkyl-3-oxoalkanoate reductase